MQVNLRTRVGVVAVVIVMLLGGHALAGPIETAVVPGLSFRNGDWVAVDALGVVLVRPGQPTRYFAIVMRSELAIGGVGAGFGPATNLLSGPKEGGVSELSNFLGSGILSLEARVERMYGPR